MFVDTPVLLFAAGEEHPRRADCVAFLERCRRGQVVLHCSIEAIQEFTFHRMRRVGREQALREAGVLVEALVLHPFDLAVLGRAHELLRDSSLRGRDAVHAATAVEAGFEVIVSTDDDFDDVPGLRRVDPRDA